MEKSIFDNKILIIDSINHYEPFLMSLGFHYLNLIDSLDKDHNFISYIENNEFDMVIIGYNDVERITLFNQLRDLLVKKNIVLIIVVDQNDLVYSFDIARIIPDTVLTKPFDKADVLAKIILAENTIWRKQLDRQYKFMNDTIVVIDDEKIIGIDLARRIERMGFGKVRIYFDLHEATEFILDSNPKLVVSDYWTQSNIDDIENLGIIRMHSSIPFIFYTAFCDYQSFSRMKKVRADDVLCKPTRNINLYMTINNVINRCYGKCKT